MKIVSISLIRNEEDILETFVRYHCTIVDLMVIIDHRSSDLSREILLKLQDGGLPLDIREETAFEYKQSEMMTSAMREVAEQYYPDWILPIDADEFITTKNGENFRDFLSTFPGDKVIKFMWRTYVPSPDDDQHEKNVLKRIQHRRGIEDPRHCKILIPRIFASNEKYIIAQGNHDLYEQSGKRRIPCPSQLTEELSLAHFPVRTAYQIASKALVGWPSNVARHNKGATDCFQWKSVFDRCKTGTPLSANELHKFGMEYSLRDNTRTQQSIVYDPSTVLHEFANNAKWEVPQSQDSSNLIRMLAETSEILATQLAEKEKRYEDVIQEHKKEREAAQEEQKRLREAAKKEQKRLQDTLQEICTENARRAKEYQQKQKKLQENLNEKDLQLQRIMHSRSWQWTAPLRKLDITAHHFLPQRSAYLFFGCIKRLWVMCGSPFPKLVYQVRHELLGCIWPAHSSQASHAKKKLKKKIPKKESLEIPYPLGKTSFTPTPSSEREDLLQQTTDIIIPTHNNAGHTVKCLEAIEKHTSNYRIVWVDNGSKPEEIALVEKTIQHMPHIALKHPRRLGFVRATNMGIAASSSEVIVLLNNDTEVTKGWLEALITPIQTDPAIGIVGPVTDAMGSWQGNVERGSGYITISKMVAFFCTAIHREVIRQIGYLSEEYGEGFADDDDYCARARKTGWKVALAKDAFVHHAHRTTFRSVHGQEKIGTMQREALTIYRRKHAR